MEAAVARPSRLLLSAALAVGAAQAAEPPSAADASVAQADTAAADPQAAAEAEGSTLAVAAAAEAADSAGDAIDTVTVSARPPLERVQDIPRSISIVSGDELARLETNSFRNILTRIGNVGMSNQNPQASSLFIRGIGWATGVGPLDPSVGVTVDGVSYAINAMASSVNFTDIDTFDVTRGPQGTLGGKNTSAGQISVRTRRPSFVPEAEGSVGYGRFNTLSTKAAIGGPVIENLLAWRGSFYREQGDGPWRNLDNPNFTYRNTDRTYGRAQFLLTPGTDFNALLSFDYAPASREISDNYVYFNRRTPRAYDTLGADGQPLVVNQANEPEGKLTRRWFLQQTGYTYEEDFLADQINRLSQQTNNYGTKGTSANLSWTRGGYTIGSISAYKDFYFDSGGGPISIFDINRSPSTGHVEYRQLSQELRISSPTGGFADWQAGLYYLSTRTPERWTTARFGSDAGAYYATPSQYQRLDANTSGQVLMGNALNRLYTKQRDSLQNESAAAYGSIDWNLTEALRVATGLRLTREDRRTRSSSGVVDQGYGAELNPVAINNVALGGFASYAAAGSRPDGSTFKAGELAPGNSAEQLALADSVALKYFGIGQYAALGDAQRQQVADAKAIRLARLGSLYQPVDARPFKKVLPTFNISPSYRLGEDHTLYASWQHGEKAGISQIVGATANGGKSAPVKAEKNDAYEIGIKSALLERTLLLSVGFYLQNIKDYIQPMYFYDEAQTIANNDDKLAYTAGLGNVPKVQAKGIEVDASYSGIRNTTLRFAGAYSDARYKEFDFLAKPAELGGSSTPYYNADGRTLPGAAKFTGNLWLEHVRPVFGNKQFHADLNYNYTSRYNVDAALSRYTVVKAYGLTDIGLGFGRQDRRFDASVIVKNVFDVDYGYLGTWNTYFPSVPRWIGLTLSSRFY